MIRLSVIQDDEEPVYVLAGSKMPLADDLIKVLRRAGYAVALVAASQHVHPRGAHRLSEMAQSVLMATFCEPAMSVAAVARVVGASTEHLSRSFKKDTGCTIGSRLRDLRLQAAHTMLMSTALSVKEVASACGYRSTAVLCRAVRREFGVSPSGLRELGSHDSKLVRHQVATIKSQK